MNQLKRALQALSFLFYFTIETLTPVIRLTAKFSLIALAFYAPYKIYSLIPARHHKRIANDIRNAEYIQSNNPSKFGAVIKLHLFLEEGEGYCSGVVVDATHAFTAAHCTPGLITDKTFATDETETSHVNITDYHANTRGDYAVLIGDFSKFNALLVETRRPVVVSLIKQPVSPCGYPMGQKDLVCTEAVVLSPMDSSMVAVGEMYPGMSGGPVVVRVPVLGLVVVAVNTGTWGQEGGLPPSTLILSPLIGITAL